MNTRRKYLLPLSVTLAVAIVIVLTRDATAAVVPNDYRVATDFSNATDLLNYDDMGHLSGDELTPWDFLRDTNGDHILNGNYRMWFLDEGIEPGTWDSSVTFIEGLGLSEADKEKLYRKGPEALGFG